MSDSEGGKLRQWVAEVDRDKLKGWLEEAQQLGAGAVSVIGTQGEKLADRAPGAFDKLAGAAKERLEPAVERDTTEVVKASRAVET